MKMKKYYASSIPEAMKQVRAELGEDAVILNSKVVITKKFFGMIKKKSFEVVAGIDAMEPRQVASVPTPAVLPVVKKKMQGYKRLQMLFKQKYIRNHPMM